MWLQVGQSASPAPHAHNPTISQHQGGRLSMLLAHSFPCPGYTLGLTPSATPPRPARRFCLFPIKYQQVWEFYKKAEASFWTGGVPLDRVG